MSQYRRERPSGEPAPKVRPPREGAPQAEILLAVDPAHQSSGVGTFILDHLEKEAAAAGLNYMYNVVRDGHPEPEAVTAWLRRRGFELQSDGRLLRKVTG